ncbi:MAG: tRNA (5-methylaminomethyl-2-thiouridine)(34)-methyltransferase MnmD [Flavobacteriales bacterium]|nr:tRNA (5-methylaminomethyl-2-thiouridine)(34)-methyltransferase MnmD [Flavobacteriales bacterium]
MEREIIKTADGSYTLFVPALNEHYHSVHGALTESLHVYIQEGLRFAENHFQEIKLLEIGLGTGLNLFLTLQHAQKKVFYTALEPYPLEVNLIKHLHTNMVEKELAVKVNIAECNKWHSLTPLFSYIKKTEKVEITELPFEEYHLVYFDAFAPRVQSEIWTEQVFYKLYQSMQLHAVLVTYCCKGDVRRALKSAGFWVEKLPGPPGKREMLRAVKK